MSPTISNSFFLLRVEVAAELAERQEAVAHDVDGVGDVGVLEVHLRQLLAEFDGGGTGRDAVADHGGEVRVVDADGGRRHRAEVIENGIGQAGAVGLLDRLADGDRSVQRQLAELNGVGGEAAHVAEFLGDRLADLRCLRNQTLDGDGPGIAALCLLFLDPVLVQLVGLVVHLLYFAVAVGDQVFGDQPFAAHRLPELIGQFLLGEERHLDFDAVWPGLFRLGVLELVVHGDDAVPALVGGGCAFETSVGIALGPRLVHPHVLGDVLSLDEILEIDAVALGHEILPPFLHDEGHLGANQLLVRRQVGLHLQQ